MIESLVYWQPVEGKLPVRFGVVEDYDTDKYSFTIRRLGHKFEVASELVKFEGSVYGAEY